MKFAFYFISRGLTFGGLIFKWKFVLMSGGRLFEILRCLKTIFPSNVIGYGLPVMQHQKSKQPFDSLRTVNEARYIEM